MSRTSTKILAVLTICILLIGTFLVVLAAVELFQARPLRARSQTGIMEMIFAAYGYLLASGGLLALHLHVLWPRKNHISPWRIGLPLLLAVPLLNVVLAPLTFWSTCGVVGKNRRPQPFLGRPWDLAFPALLLFFAAIHYFDTDTPLTDLRVYELRWSAFAMFVVSALVGTGALLSHIHTLVRLDGIDSDAPSFNAGTAHVVEHRSS